MAKNIIYNLKFKTNFIIIFTQVRTMLLYFTDTLICTLFIWIIQNSSVAYKANWQVIDIKW